MASITAEMNINFHFELTFFEEVKFLVDWLVFFVYKYEDKRLL